MSRSVVMAVRSDSFAGVEQYICASASELDRRGWEVAVVGGAPEEMARRLPAAVRCEPATGTADVVRALRSLGRRPLVHAHMSAAEVAAVVTRPMTRAKVVSTRHFAAPRGSRPPVAAALRLLARGVSAQVAISGYVSSRVDGSSTVILNGVPSCDEQPDDASRRVLLMQRLEPEKDTLTALHAWRLSGLQEDGWSLEVVGRGSLRGELVAATQALGIDRSVTFTGFTADPAAARRRAAVFLATATAEPYGLAVVEAMAQGMPVVATRAGAHPETVGDAGLLFGAGDAQACAEYLRQLATDPDKRHRLGAAARARQRRLLTIEAHVDALEAFYADVVRGKP